MEHTGLDPVDFAEMEEMGRELFRLGTARAAARGLILVDTKYELIVTGDGKKKIADEVHTPDSSRFVMAEGFIEAISRGETPRSLSKEFVRGIVLARANGDVNKAKELMKEPLPVDVVDETAERYHQLHRIFTGV